MSIEAPGGRRLKVVVTDREFSDLDVESEVLSVAGMELTEAGSRDPETLVSVAADAGVLMVQYATISAELMDSMPGLELVVRYGVGLDSVDLDAAASRGIGVCNVVDYGTEEVASHTAALILAVHRHVGLLDRQVRTGGWDYRSTGSIPRLSEQTLGLVGLGRVGRMVAERLEPWFHRVIAADPFAPAGSWPSGVQRVGMEELAAGANVLSLHLPLTAETAGLVDAVFLSHMPMGAVLVNTARGGLVDTVALVDALDNGRLRGAGLDVVSEEPPPQGHPSRDHPRITCTPHGAWYSESAERALRQIAAQQVVDWVRNQRPACLVVDPDPNRWRVFDVAD